MSYTLNFTNQFKKDFKICQKRGYPAGAITQLFVLLESGAKLPEKYKAHKLSGYYSGYWECHIKPDWLIIWEKDLTKKQITLIRTGTHSDLFS